MTEPIEEANPFTTNAPVIADGCFVSYSDIEIVPGVGVMEPYVIKLPVGLLEVGAVVAVFEDPDEKLSFEALVLVGFAQVIEECPLLLRFVEVRPGSAADYPKFMRIVDVKFVFAFNSFGVGRIPAVIQDSFRLPMEGVQVARVVAGFGNVGSEKGAPMPPPLTAFGESTFKARQNAEKSQNAKVLLRHNKRLLECYFGPMDDTEGPRAKSALQGVLQDHQLRFIMMQSQNVHLFLKLFFQRTATVVSDLAKPVAGLHLLHFRAVSVVVDSHYQVRLCMEHLVAVLRLFAGGDEDRFIADIFAPTLTALSSVEEGSLSRMGPVLVIDELSAALVAFSLALASPAAVGATEMELSRLLRKALTLDLPGLERRDMLRFKRSMEGALKKPFRKRMTDDDGGGGSGAGTAATGRGGGSGGRGAPGTNYCITDVCFVYLGSKVYDGKPALRKCAASGCVFVHDIPRVPVSAAQKADLARVSGLIRGFPQRHAALLNVISSPTFSH